MVGVSKTFTNQKRVLNNIYLSFFYGAKIGIIGLNGSGKSTLMKIIAGIDKNFDGEVVFSPGYTVGYLEQEPRLDDSKTVREVVEEGCATTVALLKEYEEINQKLCEPMDDDTMARLRSLILALNETWKGEAQAAFVAKFESMQSSFTSFSEMLEGYATLMDTAARELQNTDQGLKATMQSSFN